MGRLHHSTATLRVMGDDLIPEEVTTQLGSAPSYSHRKGDRLIGPKTGRVRVAPSGMWQIEATAQSPEDLDDQVREILTMLTVDMAIWMALAERFEMDLFCGLFMEGSMEGFSLSADTLEDLGRRGIALDFDIYS